MKKWILILLAAYLLAISYFFLVDIIFKKEIEQWKIYKEVVYDYSQNYNKEFQWIKPEVKTRSKLRIDMFDDVIVVGVAGNYTEKDYITIAEWIDKINDVIQSNISTHITIVNAKEAIPKNCKLFFSFDETDSMGFSNDKVAVYSTQIFNKGNQGFSYTPRYFLAVENPTRIDISTKYSDQDLRDFIIKQSILSYFGIYKNYLEMSSFFDALKKEKFVFISKRKTHISLWETDEYRTLRIVYNANYKSYFNWKPIINKIKDETGVFIDERGFLRNNIDYTIKFPGLELFKNSRVLTELDKSIIKNHLTTQLNNTVISSKKYPDNVAIISYFFIGLADVIFICLLFLLLIGKYFDSLIFLIIPGKLKNSIIYKNLQALIPLLIYYIISYLVYIVSNPFSYSFNIPYIIQYMVNVIEIMVALNLVFLFEKNFLTKTNYFYLQQIGSIILAPIGILITNFIISTLFPLRVTIYTGAFLALLCFILVIVRFIFKNKEHKKRLRSEEKNKELAKLNELKTRAELDAIQSRINPHFLYNSLNSIASLAHDDANKVEQMSLALSKLFRNAVNKDNSDFATIASELEMVKLYLDIEKVRFGKRLEYSIDVPESLNQISIPRFIIQPLIENAIKHGISNNPGNGILQLVITKSENNICITVYDNGPAFPEDMVTGYGLKSIYERLDILFPQKYSIQMQNAPKKNIKICLTI